MRLMEDTVCNATQQEILKSGITMRGDDDQRHAVFLRIIGDGFARAVSLDRHRFYRNALGR